MYAIIKFREIENAVKFDQVVAGFAGWELKLPLNSKVEGCVRILNIGGTKMTKLSMSICGMQAHLKR